MNKKIFFVFALSIFFLGFVAATFHYTDYDKKWELCNALNKTGTECDSYWENASDFSSLNQTQNTSGFYSKAEIDSMFSNITQILNVSNGTIIVKIPEQNQTDYVTHLELENRTQELWNIAISSFVSNQTFNNEINQLSWKTGSQSSSSTSEFNPLWILVIFAIAFAIYFVVKDRKKQPVKSNGDSFLDDPSKVNTLVEALIKKGNKATNKRK